MRFASLKTAAALAVAVATSTTAYAAQDSKVAYDRDLSCAAYHLEIAGFYKSDMGRNAAGSDTLAQQYSASGTTKLSQALAHAKTLGKTRDAVKADLFRLIEDSIARNVTAAANAEFVLAHVKDTTLKADTCQRSAN